MGATEERRRHPFWLRPKTRSFVRLAWPAMGAWVATLVWGELFDPGDTHSPLVKPAWIGLGVLGAVTFFYLLAFAYVLVAAAARAPVKVRLFSCAANLSAPILAFMLLWPRAEPEQVAEVECKHLHDKAMLWKTVRRMPPESLDEMVAPLRPEYQEDYLAAVPDDPWGHPYVLEVSLYELRVRSFGPDGKKGTDDDIVYAEGGKTGVRAVR